MIPVMRAPEPASLDLKVRQPGMCAIAGMVGRSSRHPRTNGKRFKKIADRGSDIPTEQFPNYWTRVLDHLMTAYHQVCAYSCFRIHPVSGSRSADHFAPKSRSWRSIYEWSNYRLCCGRINVRRNDFGDVLDPFVYDGKRVRYLPGDSPARRNCRPSRSRCRRYAARRCASSLRKSG
jgi:hypothetical protein